MTRLQTNISAWKFHVCSLFKNKTQAQHRDAFVHISEARQCLRYARKVWGCFFFYCVAERAVKPCRSSRSKTRGGMIKSHDTCKTGSKHQNPNNKNRNQTQANTKNDRRQVSVDGETCGEKKVKRPKLSCVELHQEAKEYHVSSSVKDEVDIP